VAIAKPAPKPEEAWHQARLIPTTGIGGQDEQEQRATSSLLAVMRAVPQFGRALVAHLGAPAGRIDTYTEVRFLDADEKTAIPDGAIVVERGRTRWVCLVEVKTGGVSLRTDQVERYLDLARTHGFDAVLTISNQITASPTESPIPIDARKTKKVVLRHLPWWQVMTEARVWHVHRGISDTDQAWILGELIAYLDHEKAGAGGFDDMGEQWVTVRDGARQHTLRLSDKGVRDVASRWEQFVQYLALGLCQDLGREVDAVSTCSCDRSSTTAALRRPSAYPMPLRRSTLPRIFVPASSPPAWSSWLPVRVARRLASAGSSGSSRMRPTRCGSRSDTRTPRRQSPRRSRRYATNPSVCCFPPIRTASPARSGCRWQTRWGQGAARSLARS
jgi:hypothetical protein